MYCSECTLRCSSASFSSRLSICNMNQIPLILVLFQYTHYRLFLSLRHPDLLISLYQFYCCSHQVNFCLPRPSIISRPRKSKTSSKRFFQFPPSPSISISIPCLTQTLLRLKHRNHPLWQSTSMYVQSSSSLHGSNGADRCLVRGRGRQVCIGIRIRSGRNGTSEREHEEGRYSLLLVKIWYK